MGPPRPPAALVAIVGAGPVGLSLALGLARHGVRSTVLERAEGTSEHSKAPGIHVRTREVFRQWGVEQRLLASGVLRTRVQLHAVPARRRPLMTVDLTRLADEAHRPGLLILEQDRTEALLLAAVRATGLVEVRFGAEVTGLDADPGAVRLRVRERSGEREVPAAYAVGCDGADSTVRGALGQPFAGLTYSLRPVLADVRVRDRRDALPDPRLRDDRRGMTAAIRLRPGLWRLISLQRGAAPERDDVPAAEVRELAERGLGPGHVEVVWASRFRIHRRSSPTFRSGRALLAGDAAHVHSPVGGQGMNAGIQDAHNLAWKLAAALDGGDVDRLLDSYDVERRAAVVGGVTRTTDLATRLAIQAPAPVRAAVLRVAGLSLAVPGLGRAALRRWAMLDLGYPPSPLLAEGVPAAGRRLPNPLLRSPAGGRVRLHDLLTTRPALLAVGTGAPGSSPLPPEDVVVIEAGGHDDPTGALRALAGGGDGHLLVRPDLHVGWAGQRGDDLSGAVAHALGWRAGPGPLA